MASKRNWSNSGETGLLKLLEEDSKEKSIFLSLHSPVSYRWRKFVPEINPVQQFSSDIQKQRALEGYLYWIFKNQTKQTLIRHIPCACSSALDMVEADTSPQVFTGLNFLRHKPGTAGFPLTEAETHHPSCQPPHGPGVQPSPAQSCSCTSVPCESLTEQTQANYRVTASRYSL